MATLYALVSESGVPIEDTVSTDKQECWCLSFEHLSSIGCGNLHGTSADGIEQEQGGGIKPAKSIYFYRRFWMKKRASQDYARRWGWAIKEVRLQVINPVMKWAPSTR